MNFHADNLSLHENVDAYYRAGVGDKVLYSQTYYPLAAALSSMKSTLV